MASHIPLPPRYHLLLEGEQKGPFTLAHLQTMWRRGEINPQTMFWLEGEPDWKPVGELQSRLEPRSKEEIQKIREARRPGAGSQNKGSRALRSLSIIAVIVLLIVGFVVGIVLLISRI